MFDTLFTIAMTASAAAVIAFLSYALAGTPRGRLTVAVALVAWFAVVVALGDGDHSDVLFRVAITEKGQEAARRAFPYWKRAQDATLSKAATAADQAIA